ncbi:hypothetical protein HU200_010991 [Digitaria exilis]|uniref:NAC domain-containing protein n=1 Tax=Digitaria exilis TaxID=1010633 RepID=A0A835KR77_9POAL|nr:hypothetical protein HU200_010991 [Digitaria exilis]CAB3497516.1 unnamed protein product [Digitaria exilis]
MASPPEEAVIFSTSDDASIALLRRLRAGATVPFVHHVDVCSAAPADLVADLAPAPGTDLAEDGYNSIWLFYCPKRFKNAQGKAIGHRQRAIAGGDTCWHSETAPRPVKGLEGATFCNLSFGRKEEGSSRSFNRMGWCMTEFDDKINGGGDHVLCKVHRSSSSLAKGKLKPSSGSSKSKKRKATGDHPQAPPSKMSGLCTSVEQVDHQVQPPSLSGYEMTDFIPVDYESLFPTEEEQLQQNTLFPAAEEHTLFPATEEQHNTLFPAAEEDQLQQNVMFTMDEFGLLDSDFTMDDLSSGQGDGVDYGACLPDSVFNMDEPSGIPEYCGHGAQQQRQQQNTFFPAEEQQQNTMEELLRGLGCGEYGACTPTFEDLFNSSTGCCDTPKAMAPPEAAFFEGLAAF